MHRVIHIVKHILWIILLLILVLLIIGRAKFDGDVEEYVDFLNSRNRSDVRDDVTITQLGTIGYIFFPPYEVDETTMGTGDVYPSTLQQMTGQTTTGEQSINNTGDDSNETGYTDDFDAFFGDILKGETSTSQQKSQDNTPQQSGSQNEYFGFVATGEAQTSGEITQESGYQEELLERLKNREQYDRATQE